MAWFYPVFATATSTETASPTLILAGVLLTLIVIYFASKVGGSYVQELVFLRF